jgi:hypothetical protein
MSNLAIHEFRVTNFRNIDDSGWIPLERVTALVGRNESGKSALLKALHKFNPASKEPFNPQKDFPRDRFTRDFRDGADWPACSVKFQADPAMWEGVQSVQGQEAPKTVAVTRYYDGSLSFEFEPMPSEPTVSRDALDQSFQDLRRAATNLTAPAAEQEPTYQTLRTDLLNWCDTCEDRLQQHSDLKTEAGINLLEIFRGELNAKVRGETAAAVTPLKNVLNEVLLQARIPPVRGQLEEAVERNLPIFIYFENYGILDSAVFLPRFVDDTVREPHNPRFRTINAMFKHVGLEAKDILELGQSQAENMRRQGQQPSGEQIVRDQQQKELRSIKLNSASNDITAKFSSWWKQRRHKIRYEADGDFFRIWVSDDRRPNVDIELEGHLASLFLGQTVRPLVLLDGDDAGRVRRDALLKELYSGHENAVLMLDDLFGAKTYEVEDILGEKALLPVLNEMLPQKLTFNKDDRANGSLPDQIKASAARHTVDLPEGWKAEVARRLASKWAISPISDIPSDVLDRAATLFEEINKRFTVFDQEATP